MRTAAESHEVAARRLRRAVAGEVHLPGDDAYDAQRQPLHPTIDPRPAMVVEASGAADVRAAVVAARDYDLPLAVQATGHGTHVPADGAILLRTSDMATVLVDPDRGVARVGAGAVWGDVVAAAAPFGLAPLSGSSPDVGVTGYTLGGGVGWLARRHGFAADSLLRAEVVTADGSIVTATATITLTSSGPSAAVAAASAWSLRWSCVCTRWPRSTPAQRASPSIARPTR